MIDPYEAKELVSNWGEKVTNSDHSEGRGCLRSRNEECTNTLRRAVFGSYVRMAINVVGFAKDAPYSSATQDTLAVICRCEGCGGLYWYHIQKVAIETFVTSCPNWPQEQKDKFKS